MATLTFNLNGGSGSQATIVTNGRIPFNKTFDRDGYNFLGWATTKTATSANSSYTPGTTWSGTSDLTVYAVWTESAGEYRRILSGFNTFQKAIPGTALNETRHSRIKLPEMNSAFSTNYVPFNGFDAGNPNSGQERPILFYKMVLETGSVSTGAQAYLFFSTAQNLENIDKSVLVSLSSNKYVYDNFSFKIYLANNFYYGILSQTTAQTNLTYPLMIGTRSGTNDRHYYGEQDTWQKQGTSTAVELAGDYAGANIYATLYFKSFPSVPRNLNFVSSTETSVSLSWDPPSDNGGAKVSGYLVFYRKSGSTNWLSQRFTNATLSTYTVTGLEPSTTYEFKVGAQNAVTNQFGNTYCGTVPIGSKTGTTLALSAPVITATWPGAQVNKSYNATITVKNITSTSQVTIANPAPSIFTVGAGSVSGTTYSNTVIAEASKFTSSNVGTTYTFTITATTTAGTASDTPSVFVNQEGSALTDKTISPVAYLGKEYSDQITGFSISTYAVKTGTSLPEWLSLDQATGALTGTPSSMDLNPANNVWTFGITATGSDGKIHDATNLTITLYFPGSRIFDGVWQPLTRAARYNGSAWVPLTTQLNRYTGTAQQKLGQQSAGGPTNL